MANSRIGNMRRAAVSGVEIRLSSYSQAYRHRLARAFFAFKQFLRHIIKLSLVSVLSRPQLLDDCLHRFVIAQHATGNRGALWTAKHAALACQSLQPRLRGQLVETWSTLRAWEESRASRLRPPMPVGIWVILVGLARAKGLNSRRDARARWWMFAVLIEIGFLCLLRPGEMFKLTFADISLPGSITMNAGAAAIRLQRPKNHRQMGYQQFVLLRNPNASRWLALLCGERTSPEPLWAYSQVLFRSMLNELLGELNLGSCKFGLSSLRPGGATYLFQAGVPVSTLRFLGRWTVERSLSHYLQEAVAFQLVARLQPSAQTLLRSALPLALCTLSVPRRVAQPDVPGPRWQPPAALEWQLALTAAESYAGFGTAVPQSSSFGWELEGPSLRRGRT